MRHAATVCVVLSVLAFAPSQSVAQPPRPKAKPADAAPAAKTDPQALAQLRAELQELRGQMTAQWPAAAGPGWRCPWGGPGMGPGPAWGGAGRGPGAAGGRGPGFGPGPGFGRGPGFGPGPGFGRGPGFGPGPGGGRGPGAGRGPGYGRGAGWGAGAGRGPAFVDEDQDGICDNYQRLWGKK
jgi:hypothetical protein